MDALLGFPSNQTPPQGSGNRLSASSKIKVGMGCLKSYFSFVIVVDHQLSRSQLSQLHDAELVESLAA